MSHSAFTASARPASDPFEWRRERGEISPAPRLRRRLGFMALGLAAVVAAGAALHFQAARLHAAKLVLQSVLSLASKSPIPEIQGLTSHLVDGGRTLLVEGELTNRSDRTLEAPALRLAVRSADHAEIFVWTAHLQTPHLAPGARTRFSSKLASPPTGGVEVTAALPSTGG